MVPGTLLGPQRRGDGFNPHSKVPPINRAKKAPSAAAAAAAAAAAGGDEDVDDDLFGDGGDRQLESLIKDEDWMSLAVNHQGGGGSSSSTAPYAKNEVVARKHGADVDSDLDDDEDGDGDEDGDVTSD